MDCSGFPHSQDKRFGISKLFLSFLLCFSPYPKTNMNLSHILIKNSFKKNIPIVFALKSNHKFSPFQ